MQAATHILMIIICSSCGYVQPEASRPSFFSDEFLDVLGIFSDYQLWSERLISSLSAYLHLPSKCFGNSLWLHLLNFKYDLMTDLANRQILPSKYGLTYTHSSIN